ncbi:hypothetical protein [Sorangium cellulosum]|uniref:Uncharacterized protein n=1 Tax=Sorangium cellulosum TaxID=56 RepID=A0A150QPN3_SORCE|nr:hypothetical protein [Sorangium cellulosum]KYF69947.1 hypothetical protein BE15_06195 [Sorangium cellulosum]
MKGSPPIDLEALFVALVLAPSTFSRNRFYSLYADPETRRVRRRAALLRSIVRQLVAGADRAGLAPAASGGALLTYDVPSLGLKRTAALDALELAVLRIAVARGVARGKVPPPRQQAAGDAQQEGEAAPPAPAAGAALPRDLLPEPADTSRIERALARLLPEEGLVGVPGSSGEGQVEPGGPDPATRTLPRDREQRETQAP